MSWRYKYQHDDTNASVKAIFLSFYRKSYRYKDLAIDMNTVICDIDRVFQVGDVVRKLRRAKKWTVIKLADEAGVAKMTVSAIERGSSNYRRETLDKISAALGTTSADLHSVATRDSPMFERGAEALLDALFYRDIHDIKPTSPELKERTYELVRLWWMLDEEAQDLTLRNLRKLAGVLASDPRAGAPSTSDRQASLEKAPSALEDPRRKEGGRDR